MQKSSEEYRLMMLFKRQILVMEWMYTNTWCICSYTYKKLIISLRACMHAGYSQLAEVCGICMPSSFYLQQQLLSWTLAIINIHTDWSDIIECTQGTIIIAEC